MTANDSRGWRWVERFASANLEEVTKQAGFDPGPNDLKAICKLSRSFIQRHRNYRTLSARRSSIVKARPYNAPAKSIEGLFGVLEGGVFSMLPGWIGGNRMDKKTANIGKAPTPYPGDEESFRRDLALMIEAYETHPQSGTLRGRSPRQAFADAVAAGWERMDIDPDALRAAFARNEVRTVNQGAFSYKSEHYTAREIQRLAAGTQVCVRVPLFGDRSRLPVLDIKGRFICMAEPDRPFDALDPAGAREAAVRVREHKEALAEMRRNVDPVDLIDRVRQVVAKEAPAPIPESAAVIQHDATLARIGREMAVPAPEREAARRDAYEREQEEFARNLDRLLELKRASG